MEQNKKKNRHQFGEVLSEKARSGITAAKESAVKAKSAVSASAESLIQSIDQNGDGKLGFDDLFEIRRQLQEKQRQAKLRRDIDALNPIFTQNLSDGEFLLSNMIRIAQMDKKHASSSVCMGSIGHETLVKDLRLVTIYEDRLDEWGLKFYPDANQEFYYANPFDSEQYIAIESFFEYLRQARVGELQRIAQDLGARYFKVTIKEQKKTLLKQSKSAGLSGKTGILTTKLHGEQSSAIKELSDGEIAAQTSFEGHAPIRPKLIYYRNEPQIKALIDMRMDNAENAITEQHLSLKCARSSGITEKTAATIDEAFKAMKCAGNTTFASEAQNETRQVFEYDILF